MPSDAQQMFLSVSTGLCCIQAWEHIFLLIKAVDQIINPHLNVDLVVLWKQETESNTNHAASTDLPSSLSLKGCAPLCVPAVATAELPRQSQLGQGQGRAVQRATHSMDPYENPACRHGKLLFNWGDEPEASLESTEPKPLLVLLQGPGAVLRQNLTGTECWNRESSGCAAGCLRGRLTECSAAKISTRLAHPAACSAGWL